MKLKIQASCGCNTGNIRKNNEDNFFFDGKCLPQKNNGLLYPLCMEGRPKNGCFFAVFDGMGGERFGEYASYEAAHQMQLMRRSVSDLFIKKNRLLEKLCLRLDSAVAKKKQEMLTEHMGTTMAAIYFSGHRVYACNVGDSRVYRLRKGSFLQLSVDHVSNWLGMAHKKAPLTQYLGFGSDEIKIVPYVAEHKVEKGDAYLICSDGLTDMLNDFEISELMKKGVDAESCVKGLILSAIERGGHDNITAIVCRITER